MFNWKLYDTFKEAADQLDLPVTYTHGTATVGRKEFPYYIMLWTPMNKMPMWEQKAKKERMGDTQYWKYTLEGLRDNIEDFHPEFSGQTVEQMTQFSTVGYYRYIDDLRKDPTVEKWLEVFGLLNNTNFVEKEYFLCKLQEQPEEEEIA